VVDDENLWSSESSFGARLRSEGQYGVAPSSSLQLWLAGLALSVAPVALHVGKMAPHLADGFSFPNPREEVDPDRADSQQVRRTGRPGFEYAGLGSCELVSEVAAI